MKRIIFSFLLIFAISGFTSVNAQCGEELLKQALKEMGDGQYIKDFKVDLKKENKDASVGYVRFSIILNSRSHYMFNVVNGSSNTENVILQLKDGDKLLATNFSKGKLYDKCQVIIGKTKVYNLEFSFKGGVEGCASAVLSLVKQYTAEEMAAQ
ncbi:MAG: hypothetical protein JW717_09840 [Marinilabiliaceae bacterium]|nr:hypothetical protein [Marinilabiliaceae bacterium]